MSVRTALKVGGLPYGVHGLDHSGSELDSAAYKRLDYAASSGHSYARSSGPPKEN